MDNKDDDRPGDHGGEQPDSPRREPRYNDFETDEEFEESDRDTDYASIYTEDDEEPDYFVDPPEYQPEYSEAPLHVAAPELEEEWEDSADDYHDEEASPAPWPLGLILIALVAVALLGAGGYGVMQQRAAAEEEIRNLQAELATSASPQEVAAARNAVAEMRSSTQALEAEVAALSRENSSLEAIIQGLESQLQTQQPAAPKAAQAPKPTPTPVEKPAPVAPQKTPPKAQAAPVSTGSTPDSKGQWFVNFGSYGQQQRAESWATQLTPGYGSVIVSTGQKDGRTYYRVRVIGLSSREAAETAARKLEKEHGLSKLWVGKN